MTIKPVTAFLLLIIIVVVPLFFHLDTLPLAEWDESHLAGNALEMYHNHNWLVTMNNGIPDMWQTKPPLMIWLQVISMKLVGINELAVRLPAALAALGTCLLLFFLFVTKYKEPLPGLIAIGIMVTSSGYTYSHAARNGEYDSLLTMLMTGYAIFYFLYLEDGRKKYIYAVFILLTLAALTKGIQAMLFVPALLLYTFYKKKLLMVLKHKELYIGICMFLLVVLGYYLLREQRAPGYIATVWQNELGGRYGTAIEGHNGDWYIYYDWLKTQFSYWYLWVVPGAFFGIYSRSKWLRDFTVFTTILVFTYFLILANAQTKVFWYSMPAYPFLSVLAALFVYTIFCALTEMSNDKKTLSYRVLPYVFLGVLFWAPFIDMKNMVFAPRRGSGENEGTKNMELVLEDVLHKKVNVDGYFLTDVGNSQQLNWYLHALNYQHRTIKQVSAEDIMPGSTVLVFRQESKAFIRAHCDAQVINSYHDSVIAYKINGRK